MAEGEAKSEGGNPSRDPRVRFIARAASSPALSEKVPTKHRVSLHREGSGDRENGVVRDGGGHLYERKQEKNTSRATGEMYEKVWDGHMTARFRQQSKFITSVS